MLSTPSVPRTKVKPRVVQLQGARLHAAEQQGDERQRHLGARDIDMALAAGVGQADVGEAQVEREIDAEAETFPGQRGGADRQPVEHAIGIGGGFQAVGEPAKSTGPCDRRHAAAASKTDRITAAPRAIGANRCKTRPRATQRHG